MVMAKIIVLGLFLTLSGTVLHAESPCGEGWDVYGNDKCLKVINDTLKNFVEANATCQGLQATLLTIKSMEEQNTINEILFKIHKIVDEVWIGATNSSKVFQWTGDIGLSFTNWAKGNPTQVKNNTCVELLSDEGAHGKWTNVACAKKNLIVCQKMQAWSISRLQASLLDALKEIKATKIELESRKNNLDKTAQELNAAKQEIAKLKENPVPIGYIYVQYRYQPDPQTIWSSVTWTEVTSEYGGTFFRAEGAGSESFGKVQDENSPRLSSVVSDLGPFEAYRGKMVVEPGQWSQKIYSGSGSGLDYILQFYVSAGEVRPRNQAVRIWKRTK